MRSLEYFGTSLNLNPTLHINHFKNVMLVGTEAIIVHTVDQLDWFFSVVPLNLTQFIY